MPDAIKKLVGEGKLGTVEQAILEAETPRSGGFFTQPERPSPSPSKVVSSSAAERVPPSPANPQLAALKLLREDVPPNYISSLPKQTKRQKDELEKNRNLGIRCALCHGWHHKEATHVPYVGHAAVTDRLLSVDPFWTWEPVAWTPDGLPRFDASGGMWIRLTIAGMSRLGYGHGAQKSGQDPGAREKEVIGDALRNAAMRFGVALELWHKGELHPDGEGATEEVDETPDDPTAGAPEGLFISDEQRDRILAMASSAGVEARSICERYGIDALPQLHADRFESLMQSLRLTAERLSKPDVPAGGGILDDEIRF